MKKAVLLLLFVSFFANLQAQIWLDAGVKGGYGLSFLSNSNLFNDNTYVHSFTGAYNIGGKFGVNFGDVNGLTVDAMFSRMRQKFNYDLNELDHSNDIQWSNIDLYLLYRASLQSSYIEIGPMFSTVNSVTQTDTGAGLDKESVDDFYTNSYLSGVFGVGGYLAGSDAFTVMIGLRLHYSFQDLISTDGQNANYPTPVKENTYDTYKATAPLFAEFLVEFNWGLGRFGRTTCGGRTKFIGN